MAGIDLHFHSRASDGALTPTEVIDRAAAREAKPELLALTDHDCTAGQEEAAAAASRHGIAFLNGVEVSVTWGRHTVHILGLGIDPEHAALADGLRRIREGRLERARQMGDSLAKIGIEGCFEGAMRWCDNPEMISRTHFARHLVDSGAVKDVRAVFRKYMTPGKPGYVAHEWAGLEDAVGWIVSSGGMAVIAHPGRYDMGRTLIERLILDFKAAGGQGIEVASGSHSLDDMHKFALHADRHELFASSGSDFHAPGEGGRDVGYTESLPPICRPIWQALEARILRPQA
ncbi:3',5'-nucleoside bisphosphate phosphatase [Chromobacterium sp. IIBBL 290-4]|uniref:3',5'-nucleoside bisphosphate phosphatase n=1 Tax=Chromobacterium sp. IIBBL 290-4 TaxID=2953890 RepID=UPI0020B665C4|nr:3',5'-nucleoside bisphosphate phosphatase [Chromobacterium sp. IIBBL 290-4]UTH72858.1 PHP domain-containing protein [Chromobacterium sp. IIBBL 290-4]